MLIYFIEPLTTKKHFPPVFRVDRSEMEWMIKRAGASVAGGMAEAVVKLRGLPFGCSKEEIAQFFTGDKFVHIFLNTIYAGNVNIYLFLKLFLSTLALCIISSFKLMFLVQS